jgi:hypothetical protein
MASSLAVCEAAQAGGKTLGESVAEFAWYRGVVDTRPPSR